MKQPQRLTRDQKILISKRGLDPGGFFLIKADFDTLTLYDKATGATVTVPKRAESKARK